MNRNEFESFDEFKNLDIFCESDKRCDNFTRTYERKFTGTVEEARTITEANQYLNDKNLEPSGAIVYSDDQGNDDIGVCFFRLR